MASKAIKDYAWNITASFPIARADRFLGMLRQESGYTALNRIPAHYLLLNLTFAIP